MGGKSKHNPGADGSLSSFILIAAVDDLLVTLATAAVG